MENDAPHCEFMCVHADTVDRITSTMPDEDTLIDLSELFKVFGDSTRIKDTHGAEPRGALRVRPVEAGRNDVLGGYTSAQILRSAKLVSARRDGKTVFYALADDHVTTIIRQGLEHVNE